MREHPVKQFVGAFAVFATAVLVVSYGVVTSYFSGYLDYFGINIRYIDFWPHLPDFMIVAVPTILALIIVAGASYLCLYLLHVLGKWIIKKSKRDFFKGIGKAFNEQLEVSLIAIFVTICAATFGLVYGGVAASGSDKAAAQTQFIRVGPDGDKIDVLIYQNGGVAFTKVYDKQSKKFESGVKTIDFTGKTLEEVELPKN